MTIDQTKKQKYTPVSNHVHSIGMKIWLRGDAKTSCLLLYY